MRWANVAPGAVASGPVEQRGAQLPGLQVGGRLASGASQQGGGGAALFGDSLW